MGLSLGEMVDYLNRCGVDNSDVFRSPAGSYKLQQVLASEFAPFLLAVQEHHEKVNAVRTYLEIGCAAGGVARVVWDLFKPERIVVVDNNSHRSAAIARVEVLDGIPRAEIVGNSEDAAVRFFVTDLCMETEGDYDGLLSISPGVDLLFIDANHEDPYPTMDAEYYSQMVRKGGLVGFHDSVHLLGPARAQERMGESGRFRKIGQWFQIYGLTLWEKL